MPSTPPAPILKDATPAAARLTARWHLIRGRLRRNAGRHRLVALAATLLPGLLLLTGLDWLAALPPAARALGLGGLLAAALIRPFLQAGAADDAELIGRLEARWPRLRDRLRTALTTDRPPAGGLWDALRERAADDLARLPADPLAPPRPAAAWLAGAAAAGLGLWAGVEPASLGQALARLAMPFQGRPWTVVADDSPAFTLAGKPYPLRARLTGRLPGRVRIRFADREGVGERIVPVAAGDDGSATVAVPLPVQGPFTYRLTARDAVVERRVGLATAPGLLAGAPAITLRPPPYTGLPPRTTAAGLGLEALRGTVLEVTGRADRPVAAAWIEVQPPPGGAPFRLAADPPAGDAFRIRAATAAWAAGVYQADLHWADRAGLEGTLRGAWRLEEDPPPAVTLERADPTAPLTVTPAAALDLRGTAQDPLGLDQVVLTWHRPGAPAEPAARAGAWLAAWLGGLSPGAVPPWQVAAGAPGPGLELLGAGGLRQSWAPPWTPADLGLAPGDVLRFQALARDRQPGAGGAAASAPLEVRVISPAALEALLAQGLERLERQLADLAAEVTGLDQEARRSHEDGAALEVRWQLLLRQLGADGPLAAERGRLLALLRDNPGPRPLVRQRLRDQVQALAAVHEDWLRPAWAARRTDPDRARQLLAEAAAALADLAETGRAVGAAAGRQAALAALEDLARQTQAETRRLAAWAGRRTPAEVSQEDPAALDRLLARQRAAVVAAQELLDQAGAAESALEDAWEALWRAAEALPGCRWAAAAAAQREALDRLGHVRGAWQFRALALAERQLDEDGHAWEDAPAVRARALAGRGYPAAARLLRAGAVGEARGAFHHEQEGRRADLAEERRRCLRGLFDAWAARLDRSPDGADLGRLAADVDEARAWVAAPPLAAALTAWRGLLVPDAVAQARARLATIREVVNAAAGAGADRPAEELPLAGPRPPAPGAPVAAGAPAPWGHLPPRVRQALEQHARDRPLPRYEEEYLRYLRELTRP